MSTPPSSSPSSRPWPSIAEVLAWCDEQGIPHRGVSFVEPTRDEVFDLIPRDGGGIDAAWPLQRGRHPKTHFYDADALRASLSVCRRAPAEHESISASPLDAFRQQEHERRQALLLAEQEKRKKEADEHRLSTSRAAILRRGHSPETLERFSDDEIRAIGDFLALDAKLPRKGWLERIEWPVPQRPVDALEDYHQRREEERQAARAEWSLSNGCFVIRK